VAKTWGAGCGAAPGVDDGVNAGADTSPGLGADVHVDVRVGCVAEAFIAVGATCGFQLVASVDVVAAVTDDPALVGAPNTRKFKDGLASTPPKAAVEIVESFFALIPSFPVSDRVVSLGTAASCGCLTHSMSKFPK